MSRMTLLLASIGYMLAGCDTWLVSSPTPSTTPVVLQITETQDREAFDRIVAELQARGIKAVILVDADFATENCAVLQDLLADGYDLMVFVRPEAEGDEIVTLSRLTRDEQEQLIAAAKTAVDSCLGTTVSGFRSFRFDQNEDTMEILDELGFIYNLAFVEGQSYLPGHEDDSLPYRADEHGFWAVPMHAAENGSLMSAFCDMPFSDLSAEEWEALLKSEYDKMHAQGDPLLVEFHPYFSGVDEGRFQAFVHFLDYAAEHEAEFLTVPEYIQWSQEQEDQSCPICGE